MSTLFDGANKAPKVDAYELAKDLAADVSVEPTDMSAFQQPNPEFKAALDWASRTLDKGGVKAEEIDPSLGDVMRAAFQQENSVASFLSETRADLNDTSPSLTPDELYTRVTNEGMLPFLDNFRGAQTEGEYEVRKANIQRELDNRKILDAAGGFGMLASFGAAVADPVNFIPVGGAAAKAARLAKLAKGGGKVAAMEHALAGSMGAGLAEASLHATQETRTVGETVGAIAAGTVLGGAIGFAVDRYFGREIADKVSEHYDNVRTGKAKTGVGAQVVGDLDSHIEARFADDEKLSSLGVNKTFELIENIPVIGKHLSSPARVVSRSFSGAARKAMATLVSDPSVTRANAAGRRSADNVEAAFGELKGQFGQARTELNDLFNKNKAAYGGNRETFNTRVARAMANGDKSDDTVVAQAAKTLRDRVFSPIKQSLVENNVLTKDEAELLNAESYFPLVYSPDGVRGDEAAFIEFHEAVLGRTIHEDARQALVAKGIRQSDIEDTVIEFKGVRQRVPKVDENGQPVINPKTGKQVMTEKIITKGKFRELRDEAKATFESEAKELRTERDDVVKAFNSGEAWPYAGPSELDNPVHQHFEARDKVREKTNEIDRDLGVAVETARVTRDIEIDEINKMVSDFEQLQRAAKAPKSPDAAVQQQTSKLDAELKTAVDLVNTVKKMELDAIKRTSKAVDVKTITPHQAKQLGKAEANDLAKAEREAAEEIERITADYERRKNAIASGEPAPEPNFKGVYKLQERAIAKAKSETDKFIKKLEASAAKKRKPMDDEVAEHAATIKAYYDERIEAAKKARDEIVEAANDTAVAAILKARGVELDEGYSSILRKYTRDGQISDDLIQKEAIARARQMYEAIVNGSDPLVEHEITSGLRGYAKARKNPADHVTLMDKGWALSDVMAITDRYTKTAGMDSVIGRFFQKEADMLDANGAKVFDADGKVQKRMVADVELTAVKAKIRDEYEHMLANAVPDAVTEKLTKKYRNDPARLETELKAAKVKHEKKLLARRDTELEALDTVLNFARGRSANPGPQWLRETAEKAGIFNYVTKMGGQIVSSLGDPLNLVVSQGLGNTIKHGVLPVLRDFKAALRSADGDARRLARLSGANLEMEFNATMAEIGGFTNPWVQKDGLQNWRILAEKFSTLNGIKYWNTVWKQVAYNTTQARLIENALKGWGKVSTAERAWMASLGVDEHRLNDFAHYFNQQSSKTVAGGMPLARWDEWADKSAGEAFRAATYKESFNVVITPGLYDKLNAHSNPVGRMILQFRNHMFANTARLTARNAQLATLGMDKAAGAMTGFVGLLMMGALIDAMKQALGDVTITGDTVSGEGVIDQIEKRWTESPAQQLYNVNDRIGWLGPVFEASNILHATTGTGLQDGLRFLSGEEPAGTSRVGGRNPWDVLGGATAGAVSDIFMATRNGVSAAMNEDRDLTLGDVKRMERLALPMNLPYLRPLINEFNQYVGTQYDWPTGGLN